MANWSRSAQRALQLHYLLDVGALDDSDPQRLSVIITSFLCGPPSERPHKSNFYAVRRIDE